MENASKQNTSATKEKAATSYGQFKFTPAASLAPFSGVNLTTTKPDKKEQQPGQQQPAGPSRESGRKSRGYLRRGFRKS